LHFGASCNLIFTVKTSNVSSSKGDNKQVAECSPHGILMQAHKKAGVINPIHSKAALEGDGLSAPGSDSFASGKGSITFVKEDEYASGSF